jgi:VIT1/CCC1 family predicted Fe2+/Mn2+ transporter
LAAILLTPRLIAVPVTAIAAIAALLITGSVSAHLGRASKLRAAARTIAGGVLAMAISCAIGTFVGAERDRVLEDHHEMLATMHPS